MIVKPPSLARPRPETLRNVAVRREEMSNRVAISLVAGHAELVSVAEAEAIAEKLAAIVEQIRYDQVFGGERA